MKSIRFTALGIPAPKGSSRAVLAGGAAVNVPSGSDANKTAIRSWDLAVRYAAVEGVRLANLGTSLAEVAGVFFGDVALRLRVEFRMKRPKSHFKTDGTVKPNAPKWHKVKPDNDKLLRATKDGLIGIVVLDDSLFSESLARKVYADPGREGAVIHIEELE